MSEEIECALSARLTADPVERVGKSGKPWLAMSMGVGSGDAVQFVSVALFGDTVPEMTGRLCKGDRAYVEGRLQLRTWTDKDGSARAGLSVSSFHVVPLGQIGRRRPFKPKASNGKPMMAGDTDDARRDSQRPPSAGPDTEIPF